MNSSSEKTNLFLRPAGMVVLLLVIFFGAITVALVAEHVGKKQAVAVAGQIQQGINRLQEMATQQQRVNNRLPQAYIFRLSDCQKDCFYQLSVLTAQEQEIVLEKVFLGNVSIRTLRPESGVLEIILSAEASSLVVDNNLVEIDTALSRDRLLVSFDGQGKWQQANLKNFGQQLPEVYLPKLKVGDSVLVKVASTTEFGQPKSVGIYWQKKDSFSQLSVKLFQEDLSGEKMLHSEVRNFDSNLATLCLDLPDISEEPYYIMLEPQGIAEESAKNISLMVFKNYDCRGDNLPQAISQVKVSNLQNN